LRLLLCRGCGVKYQSPMPKLDTLDSLYSSPEYYSLNYPEHLFAARRRLFDYRLGLLEKLRGNAKGRVLDVGCGSGQFLEAAAARGWECHGQEFSEDTASRLRQKIPAMIVSGNFPYESEYISDSFDLVHLNHVLEHFYDPPKAVFEAHRLLKPGGIFYCEVPRQSNLQNRLSRMLGKKDLEAVYLPEHLFFFDKKSLGMLLERAGFETLSMRVEGMGDPYRYERGVHYHSLQTHIIATVVGALRLQGPLGGGNLAAVVRKN